MAMCWLALHSSLLQAALGLSPTTFHIPMNDRRSCCCADKGAPVVMLPVYKTVRTASSGQRERGRCFVTVDSDVEPHRGRTGSAISLASAV